MQNVLYYRNDDICLEILIEEETIMEISFCERPLNQEKGGEFEAEIVKQFDEYFAGKRQEFDLPFFATGTPFQLMVWEELLKIPYGQTVSYSDIANAIGRPKAQRAVGTAVGSNPIGVIIPCHRVIAANGTLGGFGGGLPVKRYLLRVEREGLEG